VTSDSEKEQTNNDKGGTFSDTGALLLHEKRYKEAIQLSDDILKTDKYNAEALYLRAFAGYMASVSAPEPEAHIKDKKFLGIAPDDFARNDLAEAMTLSREIFLKAQANSEISPLFLAVFQNDPLKKTLSTRSTDEARNKLDELDDSVSGTVDHQEVLNILDDALHLDSYYDRALFSKGKIHFRLANYDIALGYFRRALLADKYFQIETRVYIARSQMKLGNIDSAYKTLQTIEAAVTPNTPPGSYFLTRAALRSLEGDFINARKDWNNALYFRSDADSMSEELLPLKRYELVNVMTQIVKNRNAEKKGAV
jgi:tetratricopeptide (TPR) repeat protein